LIATFCAQPARTTSPVQQLEQHQKILSPLICQIQSLFDAFESFQKDLSPIIKRLFQ